MLYDIVIDTCTLAHASNPDSGYQIDSIAFLNKMLECDTLFCIDEGFSLDASLNQSRIGVEYLRHLHTGMFGFSFLATLFRDYPERICELPRGTDVATARWINQKVSDAGDKVLAKVTNNTRNKVLASHDFEHFQIPKRDLFRREKNIRIVIASEGLEMLK
jgi:hypothetical protein